MFHVNRTISLCLLVLLVAGCSSDDNSNVSEAVRRGIGAECAFNSDCITAGATCLTQFKGGYCGMSNCSADVDCPLGSACVMHDDGVNYCFLVCANKPDCNLGRSLANEANCVSNITFVDATKSVKACVPPSGG